MTKWLYIFFALVLIVGCKKQVQITDETDFELEITRDEFSDTIYWINKLNVISTSDEVLDAAIFQLVDNTGNMIYEDNWHNARNYSFALAERKLYNLTATVYLAEGDTLASENIQLDNNDYPDAIKINSIAINSSVLNTDGYYYVSNVHGTLVSIYHALDGIYNSDNYDVEVATIFYQKQFSPKKLNYTFSNFQLPARSIKRNWRYYEVQVGFPLVVGSSGTTVVNDRKVYFFMDVEQLAKFGNSTASISLYYESDDSSEGGIYTGTIEYEWVYEN